MGLVVNACDEIPVLSLHGNDTQERDGMVPHCARLDEVAVHVQGLDGFEVERFARCCPAFKPQPGVSHRQDLLDVRRDFYDTTITSDTNRPCGFTEFEIDSSQLCFVQCLSYTTFYFVKEMLDRGIVSGTNLKVMRCIASVGIGER